MSKKTMMKPIVAMFLAFAMLLTGVVPGTAAIAKAAENVPYAVFEYQDEDGEAIDTSDKIYNGEDFELAQDAVGTFKIYNAEGKQDTASSW